MTSRALTAFLGVFVVFWTVFVIYAWHSGSISPGGFLGDPTSTAIGLWWGGVFLAVFAYSIDNVVPG